MDYSIPRYYFDLEIVIRRSNIRSRDTYSIEFSSFDFFFFISKIIQISPSETHANFIESKYHMFSRMKMGEYVELCNVF